MREKTEILSKSQDFESAMDTYAQTVATGFAEWLAKNEYYQVVDKVGIWRKGYLITWRKIQEYTTEELLTEFINTNGL